MRVAILGAGALGSVYGARLARSGCQVEVVVRGGAPPRTTASRAIRVDRIGTDEAIEWPAPAPLERVPPEADVILAAVRYDDLAAAASRVTASAAPVVVLTPMMFEDRDRLSQALPGRLVAAMPSVVAYRNDAGVVRYWLPRGATTLVEARSPASVEAQLASQLARAGIAARLESDVMSRNVATTVSFMPLAMGIDAAGGIDAVLGDEALLALALEATAEACALGRALGKPEPWASMLLRFVGPFTLKASVRLARARAPEAITYVEHHFGQKLHAQNVAMGAAIARLARARGLPFAAFERLLARLGGRSA